MSKNRKLIISLMLSPLASCLCFAENEIVEVQKGKFIFNERKILIDAGWKPLETFEKTGNIFSKEFGSAKPIYNAGAVEVEFCSGTGVNYCHFNYSKDGQCLQILTGGEYFKENESPKIISWSFVKCDLLSTKK
ncbi:hypothetical protein [Cellvibrio sp. NN19]|uniref:hypothetical protein n=1 Tax=Cellvibrio chitinivorans TaxID=3102792 RepID=UPI002B407DEF|nr:hypothetical protein [Cellvibrio sp. NN19]